MDEISKRVVLFEHLFIRQLLRQPKLYKENEY